MTENDAKQFSEIMDATMPVYRMESSKPTKRLWWNVLKPYTYDAVQAAFSEHLRTNPRSITPADIVTLIDKANPDGRPGADEAWSIALSSMDETSTVISNDEIAEAYGIARPIFNSGDEVGARMAFRSSYDRIVQRNRAAGINVKWWPSVGTDKALAETVLNQAVSVGRLTDKQVRLALPYQGVTVDGFSNMLAIESKGYGTSRTYALEALANIKKILGD